MKTKAMTKPRLVKRGEVHSLYIYAENVPKLAALVKRSNQNSNLIINNLISKAHGKVK